MYINNSLVAASDQTGSSRSDDERVYNPEVDGFYLGGGAQRDSGDKFASMSVDDLTYWYGDRGYLLAFDYISRGMC